MTCPRWELLGDRVCRVPAYELTPLPDEASCAMYDLPDSAESCKRWAEALYPEMLRLLKL